MASLRDALIQSVETPDCTAFSLGLLRCSLFEADWSLWGCLFGVSSFGFPPWGCLLEIPPWVGSLGFLLGLVALSRAGRPRTSRFAPLGFPPWGWLLGVASLEFPLLGLAPWGCLLGAVSLGLSPWVVSLGCRFAAGGTPAYQSGCNLGVGRRLLDALGVFSRAGVNLDALAFLDE